MKLYYKYISNKILASFFAIVFLLVTLIWFSKTIVFVKYITENGVEISQFLFLFLLILPWLLLFIVPISLFVAIVSVYNRLIINNEIAILKNTGLTRFAIAKPALKIAVFCVIFSYFVSFFLMPYANKKLRLARLDFENNYSNIAFSEGVFENLKSLTIYIKSKDEKNQLFGILLHDERSIDYSLTITAKSGNLIFEEGSLLLYMKDGTVQRFNREEKKSEILNFDDYVFNLSDNKDDIEVKMRWKSKERYLGELINPDDDSDEKDIAKYRGEIQQRITYPLMSIILAMVAVSAMLRGGFSRHGNATNILLASFIAIAFLTITIAIYRLIETKFSLVVLLYLDFIIFFAIAYYMLVHNKFKK